MSKAKLEIDLDIPSLKGCQPQQTAKAIWDVVKDYEFETLREYKGITIADHRKVLAEKFKEKGMTLKGGVQYLANEKIEKLHVGWTIIRDAMLISTCAAWPRDDYDFPALTTTWDESEKHVHFIADFLPLTDLVMNDWYQEKYLDAFEPMYKQYTDLLDAPPEHLPWWRALSSPYVIAGRPQADPDRAMMGRALDCVVTYVKFWFEEIVAKAEPIRDPAYKEQVKARKKKIKEVYARKDPGGPVMTALVGKELAWRSLKLTF